MLSQLVCARRDVSDVNPLAVQVPAIEITTVSGDALVSSATTVSDGKSMTLIVRLCYDQSTVTCSF